MFVSTFEMFKIGIGPSSSHTVGPMRAALMFVDGLRDGGELDSVQRVEIELFGSLGATGHGHGSPKAIVLGLSGCDPQTVDPRAAESIYVDCCNQHQLALHGARWIDFDPSEQIIMHRRKSMPFHSNAMTFRAYAQRAEPISERTFYSVGGGFVVRAGADGTPQIVADATPVPYAFSTGDEMLALSASSGLSIPQMMMANERTLRSEEEIRSGLLHIWSVMQE
ncbi:MAG: serine dehydratase beta chain, partial [Antricoccus sp.]